MTDSQTAGRPAWQTPLVVMICGCLIAIIGFGPRSSLGLFLTPMSSLHGWGREVFALALAIQMLMWGAAQPFVGAIADRFGPVTVLCAGAVLYAIGLAWMAHASSPGELYLSGGFLTGFGLAGASFTVVIGAFGKLLPHKWRSLSFGLGTAGGSFGQFLFAPVAIGLNSVFSLADDIGDLRRHRSSDHAARFRALVAAPRAVSDKAQVPQQSVSQALREALAHRSYIYLVLGFFTCGFQLFFITVHLPAYLVDRGLSADIGAWTVGIIGLFNIIGSISAGYLSDKMPKRYLLAVIYFLRSLAIVIFILLPASSFSAMAFGAAMGLLWLSTVPPTNGLIALMFGTRWLTMLAGFAFFSHQVGGFLGVWLGGVIFERTGSYDIIWWLAILLGVLSAVINLPIVEKPVARTAAAAA